MQFLLSRSGKVRLESKAARRRNGNFLNILFVTWEVSCFLLKCCVLSKYELQTDVGN
jgi:hypothetical protein